MSMHRNDFDSKYDSVLESTGRGVDLASRITGPYLDNHNQTPEIALGLLARKAIEHLEATRVVLVDWHLESGKALLRVAFETIGLLGLCADDPEILEEWMFLTSLGRDQFTEPKRYESFVRELERRGRNYYDGLFEASGDPTPVSDLIKGYNSHIHASWPALLHLIGFEAAKGAFPMEAQQALEDSAGDLRKAVRRFRELRRESKHALRRLETWTGKSTEEINRRPTADGNLSSMLADELASTSIQLLSGTHHLVDILEYRFGIPDKETPREFQKWHDESIQEMGGDWVLPP